MAKQHKPKKKGKIHALWRWTARGIVLTVAVVAILNLWVMVATHGTIYNDLTQIPKNEVGVVLGTSPLLKNGASNPFFNNRMEAAATLYREGKVKKLLLSGHKASRHYDEPRVMEKALTELGVPKEVMVVDGAGYRTLDSIIRTGTVFGHKRFTIISQRDHNYRALFIARHEELEAVAYAAKPAPFLYSLRVGSREVLARVKAILDLYVLDTRPQQHS